MVMGRDKGAIVAEKKLELSLTESFAKHKRNLLFVSSIIAILAVASPVYVKIPGMGTEESVPAPVAYFLLGATLAYFFSSYWVELLAVNARNAQGVADESLEGVSTRLMNAIIPIRSQINQVEEKIKREQSILESLAKSFSESNLTKYGDSVKSTISEGLHHFRMSFRDKGEIEAAKMENISGQFDRLIESAERSLGVLEGQAGGMASELKQLREIHGDIVQHLDNIDVSSKDLAKRLDTVSDRISRSQRIGFSTLEKAIPTLLAGLAFLACIDGAFFGSSGAAFIRGHIPAIAQSQTDAVPKVGTQSTDNR